MTFQVWGAAVLLVAAAVLIGRAAVALGMRCRAAGPAVGIAALIVVASIAIKLPGRGMTAAVALLVGIGLAVGVLLVRRPPVRAMASGLTALVVPGLTLVLALAGAAIPFIASGHVGLPGVSLDNDTANHLLWAEWLRHPIIAARYGVPPGYPLGPHSLMEALSSGLGIRLDYAMTAVLIATTGLTALVAAAALGASAWWKRVLTGVLAALLYLVAAYYAEGAFKEPLMGVLLLAAVLHAEGLVRAWPAAVLDRVLAVVPLAVIGAAALYVYSYTALAWFGGTLAIWILAEIARRPVGSWAGLRSVLRRGVGLRRGIIGTGLPFAAGAVLLGILIAPSARRIASFAGSVGFSPAATGAITNTNFGNLPHALPIAEALGIWNTADFRFPPAGLFDAGMLSAFALGVLAFGLLRSLWRRELLMPAAVAACAIVLWRSSSGQSPYITAKALVIPGPIIAVIGMRGLIGPVRSQVPRIAALAGVVLAAVLAYFALYSSYQALRNEPVWPSESTRELLALDRFTRDQGVVLLGATDYAPWIFNDSKMSALAENSTSMQQALPRANKPNEYGTAFDFDSVSPATINRFQWAITTNTSYASQAPAGFRLLVTLPMYQLWRRVAWVAPRQVIEPPGAPGALLDCRTEQGRALSRRRGVAAVMAAPVVAALSTLMAGQTGVESLRLPPGRWELSLQYISSETLDISAGPHRWRMPAYLDRPGPFFRIGSLQSPGGTVTLNIHVRRPSSLTGNNLAALVTALAAVPEPDPRHLVPLREACGRYVDWYRTAPR